MKPQVFVNGSFHLLKVSYFLPPDPLPVRQDCRQKADKPVLFVVIITRENQNPRARKELFLSSPIKKKVSSLHLKTGLGTFRACHYSTGSGTASGKRELRQEETAFQTSYKWKGHHSHPVPSICAAEAYWGASSYQLRVFKSYSSYLPAVHFKEPFL